MPTHLQQLVEKRLPSSLTVEVWAMDESRFGLQTVRRRRLTLRGVKPVGLYHQRFQSFWLYGAVAPRSGEGYFQTLLALNGRSFQEFLDHFSAAYPTTFNILLLDNAPAHRAKRLRLPANVALLFQPPYSPELNPCERVWLALKSGLAWHNFDSLVALQAHLATLIDTLCETTLRSLTAFPAFLAAVNALPSF